MTVQNILMNSESLLEAAPRLLQSISEALACQYSELWQWDSTINRMRFGHCWHEASLELTELENINREIAFARGKGLIGRVWANGRPESIFNNEGETNSLRMSAAERAGLSTAVAFPVYGEKEIIGVMAFFSLGINPPDETVIESVNIIGKQIGLFFESKRREELLRQTNQALHALIQSSPLAISVLDADGNVRLWNPASERLFGWTEVEVMGHSLPNIPEDSKGQLRKLRDAMVIEGQAFTGLEARRKKKDGTLIDVSFSAAPLQDDQGNITGTMNISADITERKRIEEKLQQTNQTLQALIKAAPIAIIVIDPFGNVKIWNPTAELLFGWREPELIDNPLPIVPEEEKKNSAEFLALNSPTAIFVGMKTGQQQRRGFPMETKRRKRDGTLIDVSISTAPLLDRKGKLSGVLALMADITERKRAEEEQIRLQAALHQSAAEWQQTFDAIESIVLTLDMEGRLRRMNRAAQDLMGANFEEYLGQRLEELPAVQPWQKMKELVRITNETRSTMTSQIRDTPRETVWDISTSIMTDTDAGNNAVVIVARDITLMFRLQERARRNEIMSTLGSVVAGVAHEVRNPLFNISATLDVMEDRFGAQEQFSRYIRILRGGIDRLTNLMQELLDYGRPSALNFARGHINEVVSQAINACARLSEQLQVEVVNNISGELATVMMDRSRLFQVFQNLIENAIQHSPAGSTVVIEGQEIAEEGRRWLECTIKDKGPGIAEEYLEKIFEPFFTRRQGGIGLGLAIALRIMKEHGGEIIPGNLLSGGAVMALRLPLDQLMENIERQDSERDGEK